MTKYIQDTDLQLGLAFEQFGKVMETVAQHFVAQRLADLAWSRDQNRIKAALANLKPELLEELGLVFELLAVDCRAAAAGKFAEQDKAAESTDPKVRALHQQRNRNTGPVRRPRAPRKAGPTGSSAAPL